MYSEEEVAPEIVCEQEGLYFEDDEEESIPQPITSISNPWALAVKLIAGKPEYGDVPVNVASKVLKPYWRQSKTYSDMTPEERFNWAVTQAQEQLAREIGHRTGKYSRTKKASVRSPRPTTCRPPTPAPAATVTISTPTTPAPGPLIQARRPPLELTTLQIEQQPSPGRVMTPIQPPQIPTIPPPSLSKPRAPAPKLPRPKVPSPPTPTRPSKAPAILTPNPRQPRSRLPPMPIMRDVPADPSQVLPSDPSGGFVDPQSVNSTRVRGSPSVSI